MKRIVMTCLLMVYCTVMIVAQHAFYVYNNGFINPFLFVDVDSMTLSNVDIDNYEHDHAVTQEIWMADSVCRFPLAAIDSIVYHTPSTIYTENTRVIDQSLRNYVIGCDSVTLYLRHDIPSELIPLPGTKLLSMEPDEKFPLGFIGRVCGVVSQNDTIIVNCDQLYLSDVFERFYCTFSRSSAADSIIPRAKRITADNYFDSPLSIPTFSISYKEGESRPVLFGLLNGETGIELTGSLSFPNTRVAGCLIFDKEMGTFFSMTLRSNINLKIKPSIYMGLSKYWDILSVPVDIIEIVPLVCYMYGKIGVVIGGEGKINFGSDINCQIPFACTINVSTRSKVNIPGTWIPKFGEPKFSINPVFVSGNIDFSVGAFFEEGITLFCEKVDKADIRLESGYQFGISGELGANEIGKIMEGTTVYEQMKDQFKWSLSKYNALSAEIDILGYKQKSELSRSVDNPLFEAKLVPTFENVTYRKENGKLTLCADVKENVLPEIPVGFCVRDENDSIVFEEYFGVNYEKYLLRNGFPHYEIDMPPILKPNRKYILNPIVKLFNNERLSMKALPSCEISLGIQSHTDEATNVETSSAVLNGHLSGDLELLNDDYSIKFVFGTDEKLSEETKTVIVTGVKKDRYSVIVDDLTGGTKYYYRTLLVYSDSIISTGTTLSFETPLPVNINSLVQASSYYYPDHFEYNGKNYSFKYNCTTTVELKNDKDVENWGYVYEDPDGNKSRISLNGAPHVYSDSRFAYCRNEPQSTVRLYPFVKFRNNGTFHYGEPQDFPIAYPASSDITLSSCEFKGTATNVEYLGKRYDYCSTFRFVYNAFGGYWLKVETKERGSGWDNWDNEMLPNQPVTPIDGSNALTVNYYYNEKELKGDFLVHLYGVDSTHNNSCMTSDYVIYEHDGHAFTGCKYQKTVDVPAEARFNNGGGQICEKVINKCF